MLVCKEEHNFKYLAKQDGKNFALQVMEIPGIIVGGQDLNSLKTEIVDATKDYLSFHDPTHAKAQQCKLTSSLTTSSVGIILGIENFTVKCK